MAVQWLAHQTGPVALAGCSGGLEEERGSERQIKESRAKREGERERERNGELLICVERGI